jgi:hypothetical protein
MKTNFLESLKKFMDERGIVPVTNPKNILVVWIGKTAV